MAKRGSIFNVRPMKMEKYKIIGIGVIAILLYLYQNNIWNDMITSLVALCGAGLALYYFFQGKKQPVYMSIENIDKLSGIEFEHYLAEYFKSQGYCTKVTSITNDYGADLVLKKGFTKYVVQAKRYSSPVGKSAVQEVVAAKAYYHADKALVVTSNYFTKGAVTLARFNDVELWDRNTVGSLGKRR